MRWVIGDVHGMFASLEALVTRVRALDRDAELLFVGDYVNRGPDSRRVVHFLLTLDRARFCRGNHDDVFDQILNGKSYAGKTTEEDHLAAFQWFMQYGLDQTLLSYGADQTALLEVNARPTARGLRQFTDLVPDEHKKFIRHLPPVIEDKDIFVAHAKWEPADATEPSIVPRLQKSEAMRQDIIWRRFTTAEVRQPKAWARTGYFGHTPVQSYLPGGPDADSVPVFGPSIVLLDTACALITEGRLTAFCVETQKYLQVDRAGEERRMSEIVVPPHRLKVALLQPQIAPNTGNIGRLCVATGTELHIVRPMGFVLSDKNVRRSAMDYWERLKLTVHDDNDAFFGAIGQTPVWLLTSKAERSFWEVEYLAGDCLMFGSETHGLSDEVLARFPERAVRIPQAEGERCLNLSTAAGVALYEAIRQVRGRAGGQGK